VETFVLVLGFINLLVGIVSIGAGRWRGRPADAEKATSGLPTTTLFVPCCGDEEGLDRNLEALLAQDYPDLRLRFIVENQSDTAVPVIVSLLDRFGDKGELILAGRASGRGQKVHNLLVALDDAPASEVWAFADSDGRPDPGWLRRLVQPLGGPKVGVASTYRFYVPIPANFTTRLRSVWNASVLSLLGDGDHNFAWGGGMAIRREVFDRIGVRTAWKGSLSDDYALTHAVREAGLRVEFVPDCLVASYGDVGLRELLSWTTRQIKITRVYWPALFRIAAANHLVHVGFLVLGGAAALAGSSMATLLLGTVLALSFANGAIRAKTLKRLTPGFRDTLARHFTSYALMTPLASFVTAQAVVRALISRRIEWRGKTYVMRSRHETIVSS
jgi:ceramide glucosyltransferase